MKKFHTYSLLLIPYYFAAQAAFADEPITVERFPDADAVLVNEIERVRYNPDGTYENTDESWTKILTEKGRRNESSLRLDYSKRYGAAKIVYVGAIGADGKEREIDISATTKESTDLGSMSANIYDPLDFVISCSIPGLKIGDTLHVKTWRKTSKPRCEGQWADRSVMEWTLPILRSTFEVTAPKSLPLRKIAVRHPLGNVVSSRRELADGSIVHTFTATNSVQAFPEPDMLPLYTEVQNVLVSTAADWQELSRWYWKLSEPHLRHTNAAMTNKVEELGRDLRAIFKFVSQEVRYMGLTMEDTSPGYAPHDVDITFDNRYGVCRDKAALLVAMLRIAGFKAFPVLINVGAKMDPEVPQPFFNHAIVAVDRGNREYELMDPTNENTKDLFPAYLCDLSYLVSRPEGEGLRTSPVPSPEANALVAESEGTLLKDGAIFLESDIRFGGINDTAYRHALVKKTPSERIKTFERIVKMLSPGAELIRCEIEPTDLRDTEKPLRVRFAAKLPEMILRGETRDELSVPFASAPLGMVNFLLRGNTSLAERKYTLKLDTTAAVRERVKIDLSAGMLGKMEAEAKHEFASGGEIAKEASRLGFTVRRNFAVNNQMLLAEREITIGAVEFTPSEYLELRERIKSAEAESRKRPVFAKDPLKDANVRWIDERSETWIAAERAWTTTNSVVKEVLAYQGKKSSAELKLSFNPMVETLSLVSASVSNRNGKVSNITPKEVNVLDCGWAGRAPRYPASKLLVANLPAVEIGSIISYVIVRSVTNAPTGFYASHCFDSHEPVEHKLVSVNGWRREVTKPRRLPNEPNQPSAAFWRDQVIVASNRFEEASLEIGEVRLAEAGEDIKSIRDWMAKYVKIAGPSLYELPLALQLTPPETVLKERYATRLDYMRTMCALLRGAGYEADVVFAANDAGSSEQTRNRIKFERPNVRAFSSALCRVRVHEGGFLGLGGETREYFIGTENQYAPIGPTGYEDCDYYDPERGEFGLVSVPEEKFSDFTEERTEYCVRENGAVDLTVDNYIYGAGVGTFRKTYSEILPEDRSRRYQAILGGISQAATATGELETDVEGYPAKRHFCCYIPDFAVVRGETITLAIPPLVSSIPALTGNARATPFALGAVDAEKEVVTVRFPEAYTEIESLPKPFRFVNPLKPDEIWMESAAVSEVKDGVLAVTITRKVLAHDSVWYPPSFYELVKDWQRIASSRQSRTIVVKRRGDAVKTVKAEATRPIRFMSFNIFGDYGGFTVGEREVRAVQVVRSQTPDIVSFQEVTANWWKSKLFTTMDEFEVIRGNEDEALTRAGADLAKRRANWVNHEPLMFRKSRFRLLDSGLDFYHVSLQFEKSLTWAVLEDRLDGHRLIAFATHFWWKCNGPESDAIRELNARHVLWRVEAIRHKWGDLPVVGGGDLNCVKGSLALNTFAQNGFADAGEVAPVRSTVPSEHGALVRDAEGKCRGRVGERGKKGHCMLDHIVFTADGFRALRHQVVTDELAIDISDHSPVIADIEYLR